MEQALSNEPTFTNHLLIAPVNLTMISETHEVPHVCQ